MRHVRLSTVLALPLFFLSLACESPGTGTAWTITADTLPSGTIHVVNAPPQREPGPTWVLEEELRIGSLDEEGPASFTEIKGLVITRAGNIVVLDTQTQEIRVFRSSGEHLATFGGNGAGPGELEAAWGLMLSPEGKLWVPDHRNARISVFDPETGFEEAFPLQVFRRGYVWSGAMSHDGQILKPSITLGPPRRVVLRVYDERMTLLDSLPLPEPPPYDRKDPPGSFYWEAPNGTAMGYVAVPYYPQGEELVDPREGIWSTEPGDLRYRIKHWEPGGDTLLVLEALRPPVPIPQAERDSVINGVREGLQRLGGPRQDWSKVPEVRAAVTSIFLADEGQLWVETGSPDPIHAYDVFERSGVYVGTVETSLNILRWLPPVVRGSTFWAVVTDEFDVPYVVRAKIVEADAS